MKTIKLGKHTVEIYDNIEMLPIVRFQKFNKLMLVDSGLGSDLSDFDSHIEKAIRFCKTKPEYTMAELENLRQNVYFIQSELSPKFLSFCVLIKALDGEPCDDLSDEGLKKLLDKISDTPMMEMTAQIDAVKKKIDEELSTYFPKVFDDATAKEYYDYVKSRTIAMLDAIITGEDKSAEIDRITDMLFTFSKPSIFYGSDSIEIQYDRQFENMCLLLSQKMNVNPKTFTVLEYYNAFEFLKDQQKTKKQKS